MPPWPSDCPLADFCSGKPESSPPSAEFVTDEGHGGPRFRLSYRLNTDGTLNVKFELSSPGAGFRMGQGAQFGLALTSAICPRPGGLAWMEMGEVPEPLRPHCLHRRPTTEPASLTCLDALPHVDLAHL